MNNYKDLSLKCFFSKLSDLLEIKKFAYEKLIEVCKEQNIYFFEVPDNIINKNISDNDKKAVGTYSYLKNRTVIEMNNITNKTIDLSKKYNKNIEIDDCFPRILINVNNESDKYDVITLSHELGHHFINIRGEEQSEDLADKFIYDIFLIYLLDFFIAIEHIMLQIKLKIDYELDIDFKKMYKKYLNFRNEHPEMNLPKM